MSVPLPLANKGGLNDEDDDDDAEFPSIESLDRDSTTGRTVREFQDPHLFRPHADPDPRT